MWQAWRPHNQADVDAAWALLLDLSDNRLHQAQSDTVLYNRKRWTGWDLNPRP